MRLLSLESGSGNKNNGLVPGNLERTYWVNWKIPRFYNSFLPIRKNKKKKNEDGKKIYHVPDFEGIIYLIVLI